MDSKIIKEAIDMMYILRRNFHEEGVVYNYELED